MERSLAEFVTDATLRQKLENAGYENISDIKEAGVVSVTEELKLSKDQVKIILELVHGGEIVASQTAEDRIKADSKIKGVSFSCTAFDDLFDRYKGVPPSCITDFCGEPGTGKTQICMQLAVNAGECIYIDTEGSMFPARLRQYAESAIAAKKNDGSINKSNDYGTENDEVDSILRRIHLFRVCDHFQLVAFIQQLPSILSELNQVKLIILDSITYPLRMNVDLRLRINILAFLGQTLAQLASRHKIPVVVTNHVTEDRLNEAMTPALGDDWGRRVANRFLLYRSRETRHARYYKSSLGVPETFIQFQITHEGLKDVPKEGEEEYDKSEKVEASDDNNHSVDNDNEQEVEDMALTQPLGSTSSSGTSIKQLAGEIEDDGDNMILTQPLAPNKRKAEETDDEEEEEHVILTQPQDNNNNDEEEDVWESSHITDQIISQLPSQVSSASSTLQDTLDDDVDHGNGNKGKQQRKYDQKPAEEESYLRTPESIPLKRKRSDIIDEEDEREQAVSVHKKANTTTTTSLTTTTTTASTITATTTPVTDDDDDVEDLGWCSEDEEDLLFLEAYKYSSAFRFES